ncbi:MAG: TIGR03936 family radical SAM-associated protein [Armatimonadota bacterium]|jgi:radical SAM-linked protein
MGAEPDARWLVEIVYRKHGPAMFLGHLDVMRAFERGVRRAGLPIVHTEGFNPRPRIVFASPIGVGASGDAELVCLCLDRFAAPVDVLRSLLPRMQPGIDLREAHALEGRKPPPYHLIPWTDWEVSLPPGTASRSELTERCVTLLAQPEVLVERERKGKQRQLDARPSILTLEATGDDALAMRLDMGAGPSVKPVEVVGALGLPTGSPTQPYPLSHRLRLGPLPELV